MDKMLHLLPLLLESMPRVVTHSLFHFPTDLSEMQALILRPGQQRPSFYPTRQILSQEP